MRLLLYCCLKFAGIPTNMEILRFSRFHDHLSLKLGYHAHLYLISLPANVRDDTMPNAWFVVLIQRFASIFVDYTEIRRLIRVHDHSSLKLGDDAELGRVSPSANVGDETYMNA